MSLKAIFIGINRYAHRDINDLSGAKWDAIALHALFSDSIPDLQAHSLIDDGATLAAVREALSCALREAAVDDQVVISFSGHGSRDHRLVLHDSEPGNQGSMLAMAELGELFRASPAKSVLLVLDCCFSGEAPARVLDQTPAARSELDYRQLFVGAGRVLIAASSPTEPAWEHGGKGHGLLTKAIMDVLTEARGPVDVGVAMDRVMATVRAEAERIGQSQTPFLINYVEGGLTLPALRAGARYALAFPERSGLSVSSAVRDLITLGIDREAVEAWAERFPAGLNELQLSAINDHRVLDGRNLLTVAPTGAGKTFIGEVAAVRAVSDGRRALFLLPYKSLVNEKYEDFLDLYGRRLGYRVIRCTGDHHDQRSAFLRGKYDLAVLTYEMFLNLCLFRPSAVQRFGLVVVDEAQFITDPRRGITVELLLTLVLNAVAGGAPIQVIALSAVIGNVNGFDQWLKAERLVSTARPVPLVEGVIDRSGLFEFRDVDGVARTEALLRPFDVVVRRDSPSAQDLIVPLVRRLVADGETVLVFRNKRGSAEGCAGYLGAELGLPRAGAVLGDLTSGDPSTSSVRLRECLERGVAFHNSNLSREERVVVERAFRSPTGELRVMAATTTLAAGINTPASTVLLAENEFIGEDGRPFTVAEYKNMAGRAGRPGFGRPGRAVIYAETPQERGILFRKYVLGSPEPIVSSFDQKDLETWVLRLLSQVPQIRKEEAPRLLANTFAGYLAAQSRPTWHTETERQLTDLIQRMIDLTLVEEEQGLVRLSLLGRACAQSALSFRSCMRLVELLRGSGTSIDVHRLMMLVQCLPDVDEGTYTPVNPRTEKARPRQLAARVGDSIVRLLQRHAPDDKSYLKRCKRGLVLLDWVEGVAIEEIERRYTMPFGGQVGHGDIRNIADNTRYHLGAAAQIARVLFVSGGPAEDDVEALLRSLELGVPRGMLALLEVPAGWARGELLALQAIGVSSPEQLWATSLARLEAVIGKRRLTTVNALRPAAVAVGGG